MSFRGLAEEIAGEVREVLDRGVWEPLTDPGFNELALKMFHFQYNSNPAYRGFVARRGVDPDRVERWQDIPFLPTGAFKEARLVSVDPTNVERVFRTSGTTGGKGRRGEHHVVDLDLYRRSLLPVFEAFVLPEGSVPLPILCLVPDPEQHPESSLGFMMAVVISVWGGDGTGFFLTPDGRVDREGFRSALLEVQSGKDPVLVAGTAFALAQWMEETEGDGGDFHLPAGSRVMETGGYKGRTTERTRGQLYSALGRALGIPEDRVVSEYGMTELLSQFYEPVLPGSPGYLGTGDLQARLYRGPPWIRTLVLDPLTLDPLPHGEVGVLAHLDLANVGSVAPILTEDLGRMTGGGFQLVGRSPDSEPRGCSLAMEDFLGEEG